MAGKAEPLKRFPGGAAGAPALPLVLLAGFEAGAAAELRRLLGGAADVAVAASVPEAGGTLAGREVAVLCLGPLLSVAQAKDLAARAAGGDAAPGPRVLLTAAGADPALFPELIDADLLFSLSPGPLPAADLCDLLRGALARAGRPSPGAPPGPAEAAHAARLQALQVARRVAAQPDLASAGELLGAAVADAVAADRTACLLYDPEDEVLWSRGAGLEPDQRHESPAVGLVSFVARTGQPVRTARLAADPRYEREADDPLAPGDEPGEHLLAVPVRSPDPPGSEVLAVLSAVRGPGRPPFGDADAAQLELLADAAALPLAQLALEARLAAAGQAQERVLRERTIDLFREEAVDHYLSAGGREGDWLRISPRWMRATFWLLVALAAAALVYSLVGTIDEYATGPAVVRLAGRTQVTADQPGMVAAVLVQPGARVAAGAPLVRFASAREAAELRRLERQWELQLVDRLRDPADPGPAQSLIALQAELDLARARLAERVVRAPRSGVVSDVRCRPEQHVAAGEILLALADASGAAAHPTLVAVLPGQHRPQLRPGLPLSLELRGFEHAPLGLAVEAVSAEVVDPDEARRLLGPEIAAAAPLTGPVVLVRARFPAATFQASGRRYALHDGMWGQAEVRVRSERLIVALVPGLRAALERLRG